MWVLNAELRAQRAVARGRALCRRGRWEEAIEQFAEAAAWHPQDPYVHLELGRALARIGREEEAYSALLRSWRGRTGLLPEELLELGLELGRIEGRRGLFQEAEARFQGVLEQRPRHPQGLRELASLYYRQGFLRRALEVARQAAEVDPDPAASEVLARLLQEWGDLEPARKLLQQLAQRARQRGDLRWEEELGRELRACEFAEGPQGLKDELYIAEGSVVLGTTPDDGLLIPDYGSYAFEALDVAVTLKRFLALQEALGWEFTSLLMATEKDRPLGEFLAREWDLPQRQVTELTPDDFVLLVEGVAEEEESWLPWQGQVRERARRALSFVLAVAGTARRSAAIPDVCGLVVSGRATVPWLLTRGEPGPVETVAEQLREALAALPEGPRTREQIAYYCLQHKNLRPSLWSDRRGVFSIAHLTPSVVQPEEVLQDLRSGVEARVRRALTWIGKAALPSEALLEALRAAFLAAPTPALRAALAGHLISWAEGIPFLCEAYRAASLPERVQLLPILSRSLDERVGSCLRQALEGPDEALRQVALDHLPAEYVWDQPAIAVLLRRALADAPRLAAAALRVWVAAEGPASLPRLWEALESGRKEVAAEAAQLLESLGQAEAWGEPEETLHRLAQAFEKGGFQPAGGDWREILRSGLRHREASLRSACGWALAWMRTPAAYAALREHLAGERQEAVQKALLVALSSTDDPPALQIVQEHLALSPAREGLLRAVLPALIHSRQPLGLELARMAVRQGLTDLAPFYVPLLGRLGQRQDLPPLRAALGLEAAQYAAAAALVQQGFGEYLDILVDGVQCRNPHRNRAAIAALAELGSPEAAEILLRTLLGPASPRDRWLGQALGRLAGTAALRSVLPRLQALYGESYKQAGWRLVNLLREASEPAEVARQLSFLQELCPVLLPRFLETLAATPAGQLGLIRFLERSDVPQRREWLVRLSREPHLRVRYAALAALASAGEASD